ncbi:dethiobiotin synthase [Marinobacter zhejiangensis]|uniref:ATP-dependent dethiobiotin synthetase BioD n=1 Tax=Marinobacter zhejiangensis TaxID=488535 RepID=A0A1I4QKM5_9GAMM|nr:dethiobiotin synthase [Marinobacter zhejiangensis]SFM40173.1 dethiobiotin synthetase [Marinobacter zhejiangensis]
MAKRTFFVTGTDTGVGKTLVSAAILRAAGQAGLRTLGMKPIASGCDDTAEGLRNEDALLLQEAMTETLSYDQINPIALKPAIAPHVAAAQEQRVISAQRLVGFCRGMQMQPADLLLIEGAGGWRVPLNDRETYARVPQALEIPVIMVVPLQLGCINHALLTAEAIRSDGLKVAGWVANRPSPETMSCESDTLDYLRSHLPAPCLGVLPWQADVDLAVLAEALELGPLLGERP